MIGLSGCAISHQRHKLNTVFDHHSMKQYKAKNYNVIIYVKPVQAIICNIRQFIFDMPYSCVTQKNVL